MSPTTLTRLTGAAIVANLIGQVVIILTGGAVRLTGSGLGCSTWPECEPGTFTPEWHEATTIHPYVEWGNRMVGVVLVLIALAVAVLVLIGPKPGELGARSAGFRRLAFVPVIGVVLQGVIGGITVLVSLHPAVVGFHFLISAALVWLSTVLWLRWREGDGPARPVVGPRVRLLGWVLSALASAVLVLGVITTGAGPHSGDEEVGYRFAVDPELIARAHSGAVWLFVAGVVALIVALGRTPADAAGHVFRARRYAVLLLAVTVGQGLIGYVQYFTGLPVALVGLHLVGAALLVSATAAAVLALRVRGDVR